MDSGFYTPYRAIWTPSFGTVQGQRPSMDLTGRDYPA
jgi:hypothetical protein